MIRIERAEGRPEISVYTVQNCRAGNGGSKITGYESELERAIAFFTNANNYHNEQRLAEKDFPFKVYKNKELIKVLEGTFHTKCAYCESNFGAVTPKEIEHFRPKNAISTGASELKPGYWWIGGEYSNLLISCHDCNRQRTHKVPGQEEGVVLGKGTQFPLSDEALRVRAPVGALAIEDGARLLLNPCVDNPEQHLEFDANGNVRARLHNDVPSRMGAISIDVYALRRKGLVEARLAALDDLALVVDTLNGLVVLSNNLYADGAAQPRIDEAGALIARCADKLTKLFTAKSEYLAAKRDWLRRAEANGQFAILRAFGIEPLHLLELS